MGKVTVVISSSQMSTAILYAAVQKFFPTAEQFQERLLDSYGFKPAEIEIFVVPSDEE